MMWMGAQVVVEMGAVRASGRRRRRVVRKAREGMVAEGGVLRGQRGKEEREEEKVEQDDVLAAGKEG